MLPLPVSIKKHALFSVALIALSFSAMLLLVKATPAGAGLANDSAAYIGGARSILQGSGYSDVWLDSTLEAITHYPPLLSLSLAGLGLLGFDPLRGARILNIFLFGANTALLGLIGWRMTGRQLAGVWLAALFMLNAALLRVHVYALSEPLYLFLSLLSFLLIDLHLRRRSGQAEQAAPAVSLTPVFLAGAVSGLAFLTRYSALALLPSFCLTLFLYHTTWKARLRSLGAYLAGALPIMLAWFIRNKLVAGNVTNRSFQYHPVSAENILPGLRNFAQFLLPVEPWRQALVKSGWLAWMLAGLGLALLVWLLIRAWQLFFYAQRESFSVHPLAFTSVLYGFAYLAAVLFSMNFFDASTKFQPRILAPVYVSVLVLLVGAAAWVARRGLVGRAVVLLLMAVSLGFSGYGTLQSQAELGQAGLGYASWKWHDSLLMASLRSLPSGTIIYTNTPPAVYLVTGRASRILPSATDPVDKLPRGDYEQELARTRADLLAGRAVLALFDTANLEDAQGFEDIESLTSGLQILQKAQGDILYGKP